MKRLMAAALTFLIAGSAVADVPRPEPRPPLQIEVMSSRGTLAVPPPEAAVPSSVRPVLRLDEAIRARRDRAAVRRLAEPRIDVAGHVRLSDRPALRPDGGPEELVLAMGGRPRANRGGGICGRGSIRGQSIAPIRDGGGCGIADPVRVTQVSGVALVDPVRMDCVTAQTLDDWVRSGLLPTVGRTGGGAVALQTASGYACRARNNQAGGKISEHAKGRAIDISAIVLANGDRFSVQDDWGRGRGGRILQALHRAACGPFGTVLGPDSDRFHRDHFHFDTARYRSGAYCR
ncbi:extensin family protein [Jannaschia rubra]|uniref:extensin-like domain-containing protein n=1 Tax=Jannaschia rubra TaxID=282197 RepID=UPI00248FFD7F|nr:extensin family protein [Jannaschia rubra]